MENIRLLVIDPQNDFCDIPEGERPAGAAPALPVAGADADMKRLAAFISRAGGRLAGIHVSLDSHHPVDIAHPAWWADAAGNAPAPFSVITAADVAEGVWQARAAAQREYSRGYVEALAARGRYPLVVWPEHCLIGGWGHNVHPAVWQALTQWERQRLAAVDYVIKGANPRTEHYSAVQAEVPDPADPETLLNRRLVDALRGAERVIVAGEALSHCVANTLRDIVSQWSAEEVKKLVLLTDCCSSVPGFEVLGEAFVAEMTARGVTLARSTELEL